jgi:Tfp pilus assembly pilus retraction ATPase PilT
MLGEIRDKETAVRAALTGHLNTLVQLVRVKIDQ